MMSFWDDFNDHYSELNNKERKLFKKRSKLYSSFKHPHQIAIYEDELFSPEGHSKGRERFADQVTIKYSDLNYNGFKKMKKDTFL